jgi:hypothetical protein
VLSVFCSAGEPCTVCHEEFTAGAEVLQLPCRHCFHETCLLPWLQEVSSSCSRHGPHCHVSWPDQRCHFQVEPS